MHCICYMERWPCNTDTSTPGSILAYGVVLELRWEQHNYCVFTLFTPPLR